MVKYFVRKGIFFSLSLLLVVSFTFFLMHVTPGDPFMGDQPVSKEVLQSLYAHYGLDQPWYIQYGRYIKGLVTWNLGPSFIYEGRSVTEIIGAGLPISLILGLEALFISVGAGITLGSIGAVKQGKWQDHLCMLIAVIGISVPSFIIATFLQYFLAMKLDLFPLARWGTLSHTILPALSLAALPTAFIARLIRSNMVEVLQQDYVQTALAKGFPMIDVVFNHVLKNSLLPVITYLGPLSSAILTGSFVVEKIFGIPGLGQWLVMSVCNRDYTVIMGITVFYSAILMLNVLIVDIIYTILDPRIKLNLKKAQ